MENQTFASEAELVAAFQAGSETAFRRLRQDLQSKMEGMAWTILNNLEDVEDAIQTAWMMIWRYRASFRGHSTFSTWVYRITHNECLLIKRRRKIRITFVTDINLDLFAGQSGDHFVDPAVRYARREKVNHMIHRIARLPYENRVVAELAFVHDLTPLEIAARLGAPHTSTKHRLQRIRTVLRRSR